MGPSVRRRIRGTGRATLMRRRWWHPGKVVALTLVVSLIVLFVGLFAACPKCPGGGATDQDENHLLQKITLWASSAVIVGGLWLAWLVYLERVRARDTVKTPRRLGQSVLSAEAAQVPKRPFDPVGWLPTHRVPAGGAKAWTRPTASDGPVEWVDLGEGVEVRLEETRGRWAVVTDRSGWTGSVDRGSLESLAGGLDPEGGP